MRVAGATPASASSGSASAQSSITFCPLTASRCARPESRQSSRVSGSIASSWPSTMPRISAALSGGSPPRSRPRRDGGPRRPRRRAPPRSRPVGSTLVRSSSYSIPRRRRCAGQSNDESRSLTGGFAVPRTRTIAPGSSGPGQGPSATASSFAPRAGPESSRTAALARGAGRARPLEQHRPGVDLGERLETLARAHRSHAAEARPAPAPASRSSAPRTAIRGRGRDEGRPERERRRGRTASAEAGARASPAAAAPALR